MLLSALRAPIDLGVLLQAAVAYAIIVLLCFPLHEFAHAWTALRLGDRTAFYQGRVTLDPRAHIDPMGALLLAVAPFGWAKPVPFVPHQLRKAPSIKTGILLVSVAGPLMNILLAALAAIPLRIGIDSPIVASILNFIVQINLFLAVFNLIPLVPLDGSKVLWAIMPSSWSRAYEQIQQYSVFILLALVLLPVGSGGSLLGQIVNPPVMVLYRLLLGL